MACSTAGQPQICADAGRIKEPWQVCVRLVLRSQRGWAKVEARVGGVGEQPSPEPPVQRPVTASTC